MLAFILDLLLRVCGKATTDMPFLENYKSLGINTSVTSLISNTLQCPDYLKLTSDNKEACFCVCKCFECFSSLPNPVAAQIEIGKGIDELEH